MTEPVHPALMQAMATRQRAPRDAAAALNLGRVLAGLGHMEEAETALRDAVHLKRDLAEARFELAQHLHRTGKLDEAEAIFRALAREMPGVVHMKIALGAVPIDQDRGRAAGRRSAQIRASVRTGTGARAIERRIPGHAGHRLAGAGR